MTGQFGAPILRWSNGFLEIPDISRHTALWASKDLYLFCFLTSFVCACLSREFKRAAYFLWAYTQFCYFHARDYPGSHRPGPCSCCIIFHLSLEWRPKPTFPTTLCCYFVQKERGEYPDRVQFSHKSLPGPRIGLNIPSSVIGLSSGTIEFFLALGRVIIGGPALSSYVIYTATKVTTLCHKLTLFLKWSHYPRLLQPATGSFTEAKFWWIGTANLPLALEQFQGSICRQATGWGLLRFV